MCNMFFVCLTTQVHGNLGQTKIRVLKYTNTGEEKMMCSVTQASYLWHAIVEAGFEIVYTANLSCKFKVFVYIQQLLSAFILGNI